ncbi:MAG: PP2C family protein-serine/threonine phosphatase [Phycisphaerae bacterium]
MRILIAEDERITRQSLLRQLERWGHDVTAAEDGADAWRRFQEKEFDLVVTDWDMPNMDGRELVEHIRQSDAASYIYLIMLTGRSEKSDLVAGMEAGADDFLAKPFDRNELRVRLKAGERIIQLERQLVSKNEALGSANDRMKRDLDAASAIQRNLLPQDLPVDVNAKFGWHFEPCDELGGDILNVVPIGDDEVAMYLLDVTGHGVPAALLSVTVSQVLNVRDPSSSILIAGQADGKPVSQSPSDVLAYLNRQFPMASSGGKFMTMVYAVLNLRTGLLRYANAGHPPPFLVRPGSNPEQLTGGNLPIGVIADAEIEESSIELQPGERVYLYSDGLSEAVNEEREMVQIEGLDRMIGRSQEGSLDDSIGRCVEELKAWCGTAPLTDDISLLAFELTRD